MFILKSAWLMLPLFLHQKKNTHYGSRSATESASLVQLQVKQQGTKYDRELEKSRDPERFNEFGGGPVVPHSLSQFGMVGVGIYNITAKNSSEWLADRNNCR